MFIEIHDYAMRNPKFLKLKGIEPYNPDVKYKKCYASPGGEISVKNRVSFNGKFVNSQNDNEDNNYS